VNKCCRAPVNGHIPGSKRERDCPCCHGASKSTSSTPPTTGGTKQPTASVPAKSASTTASSGGSTNLPKPSSGVSRSAPPSVSTTAKPTTKKEAKVFADLVKAGLPARKAQVIMGDLQTVSGTVRSHSISLNLTQHWLCEPISNAADFFDTSQITSLLEDAFSKELENAKVPDWAAKIIVKGISALIAKQLSPLSQPKEVSLYLRIVGIILCPEPYCKDGQNMANAVSSTISGELQQLLTVGASDGISAT